MRLTLTPAVALAVLTFCSPGDKGPGRESGMGQEFDSTAPADERALTPAAVLSQLNVANTTEIELGKLVFKKATSPEVKLVAQRLATDHTQNQQQLQALAQKLDLDLSSTRDVAIDSTNLPPDLKGKAGAGFDKAFIQHEIRSHQAHIEKLRNQVLPAVQNQQIKAYLQKTVIEMEDHLTTLRKVDQQISG